MEFDFHSFIQQINDLGFKSNITNDNNNLELWSSDCLSNLIIQIKEFLNSNSEVPKNIIHSHYSKNCICSAVKHAGLQRLRTSEYLEAGKITSKESFNLPFCLIAWISERARLFEAKQKHQPSSASILFLLNREKCIAVLKQKLASIVQPNNNNNNNDCNTISQLLDESFVYFVDVMVAKKSQHLIIKRYHQILENKLTTKPKTNNFSNTPINNNNNSNVVSHFSPIGSLNKRKISHVTPSSNFLDYSDLVDEEDAQMDANINNSSNRNISSSSFIQHPAFAFTNQTPLPKTISLSPSLHIRRVPQLQQTPNSAQQRIGKKLSSAWSFLVKVFNHYLFVIYDPPIMQWRVYMFDVLIESELQSLCEQSKYYREFTFTDITELYTWWKKVYSLWESEFRYYCQKQQQKFLEETISIYEISFPHFFPK